MRLLLWLGFGALLVLLSVTGLNALYGAREVQRHNDKIRADYVERARMLEDIRSDIYLSGTYAREFLLETDRGKAELFRQRFSEVEDRIRDLLRRYRAIAGEPEAAVLDSLSKGSQHYFRAVEPVFAWSTAERSSFGPRFMTDELLQRRTSMLELADKVREVNNRQLQAGDSQIQSLFEAFRRRLTILLTVTLSIGALVAAFTIRRTFDLEQAAQQRFADMAQARHEAQELSAKLVDAQEEERKRIARELHDEIGQSLSALLLALGNVGKAIEMAPESQAAAQFQLVRQLAERAVSTVRNMSQLLRPSMLDDLGLSAALHWQARELSRASGLLITVAVDDLPEALPDEHKTAIYRIVQEALNNSQKHADAKRVRVEVKKQRDTLHVSIQDDGHGFDASRRGLGLVGMEERVKRLGGRLQIQTDAAGTLLLIHLPFEGTV